MESGIATFQGHYFAFLHAISNHEGGGEGGGGARLGALLAEGECLTSPAQPVEHSQHGAQLAEGCRWLCPGKDLVEEQTPQLVKFHGGRIVQ